MARTTGRMRESKVESYLKNQVKNSGGLSFKMKSTRNGVPDQMILYSGTIYLVEVKRPGEKPSPQQSYVHNLIREQGVPVHVVATIEDVDRYICDVLDATPTQPDDDNDTKMTIQSMSDIILTD